MIEPKGQHSCRSFQKLIVFTMQELGSEDASVLERRQQQGKKILHAFKLIQMHPFMSPLF